MARETSRCQVSKPGQLDQDDQDDRADQPDIWQGSLSYRTLLETTSNVGQRTLQRRTLRSSELPAGRSSELGE